MPQFSFASTVRPTSWAPLFGVTGLGFGGFAPQMIPISGPIFDLQFVLVPTHQFVLVSSVLFQVVLMRLSEHIISNSGDPSLLTPIQECGPSVAQRSVQV